jgi:YgiT-type zinc finger domain-containing protein
MPDPASVAVALAAWRAAHPTATLAEIEAAVDHHLSAERAALIADLASVQPDDRPGCPACGTPMVQNGSRTVTVTTAHEGSLPLTGPQYVCPACGAGLFPPR